MQWEFYSNAWGLTQCLRFSRLSIDVCSIDKNEFNPLGETQLHILMGKAPFGSSCMAECVTKSMCLRGQNSHQPSRPPAKSPT